ncbi:DUF4136 domain-containing protein [Porphyrobacter sp. TH134]|uniref:DUF4136 domain-containing protein n=1 Tax=Porphyrobacter sp. TH134 TaxID=2067450 RepID=UPI000C7B6B0D|nr:DUF4136 domain-containing protein [Porphyrobacter sp. TH134]PLK23801.1 DUF4136 domain-containing protein [Porphyrobacter sp. TH134]
MLSPMSSIKSLTRLALPVALVIGLSACATPFKADVSRFAVPLPAPQGQTFAVVAEDPKLAGGLEFATYANSVAAEMQELGYVRAATPEAADLLVRFDYRVDGGRERVRTDFNGVGFAGPGWGRWGGWGGGGFGAWGFGFNDPFFGGPDVRSYTIYTSGIDLKIDRAADGQRLFEGKAEAVSRSNRLPRLVPNLVDAMFTGFPGNSGETLRITIRDDEKTVRNAD